jgi:predicted Zn-dependent protease
MQAFFYTLAAELTGKLHQGEILTLYFEAEETDFVRFNQGRVRQAGSVRQLELALELIKGQRHAIGHCDLNGDWTQDAPKVQALLDTLRCQCRLIPTDPFLLYATEEAYSETLGDAADLPCLDAVLQDITAAAEDLDLVGLWASGSVYRGFANSLGQRNWYSVYPFNFDWSCYGFSKHAVKAQYAGTRWEPALFAGKMQEIRKQLDLGSCSTKTLLPGRYRVYLAPTALMEIFSLLSWSSFGLKNHQTQQSPLRKMQQGRRVLHPAVNLSECNAGGIAPIFTEAGFQKPARVQLIGQGRYHNSLASPRSSREYGVPVNAGREIPQSLELAAGTLSLDEILGSLDPGIYINHLWYCNVSDPNDARITGVTRYACFWVEKGKLQAPIEVMRFDESVYRMLGENLLGLSAEQEFLMDPGTYERRSLASARLPGALIDNLTLTL